MLEVAGSRVAVTRAGAAIKARRILECMLMNEKIVFVMVVGMFGWWDTYSFEAVLEHAG